MKKIAGLVIIFLSVFGGKGYSQSDLDTTIYLITCAPGIETYSIYGHSAVRVVIRHSNSDIVYNWGVFDFDTPNFTWKFAKGRLDYLLDASEFTRFITEYYYEKRSVYTQRINLASAEKRIFLSLINENLKPENKKYRYDFFYDDCSTRIRDLLEKALGNKLVYPPDDKTQVRTFRELTGEYQKNYPWLKLGVDLIMGTPGEKKAGFRGRMFLPLYLQNNLGISLVNMDHKLVPLLSSPGVILQFDEPKSGANKLFSPIAVFSVLFIIILILSVILRSGKIVKFVDILIFSVASFLSVLMVFFNFFTDHLQMKMNVNIIWFNPIWLVCLICLIAGKKCEGLFRLEFYLSLIFIPVVFIFPGAFNSSLMPFLLILALRSSVMGRFSWNPLVSDL
jgi:hypothetical protein